MENSEFKSLLTDKTKEIDCMLEKFLPEETGIQKTVPEAKN